jgi:hypothetical protein
VAHVGCVTVPAVGADGVAGCALTIFDDTADVHPAALVCVKVYVPALAVTNPVPDMLTTLGGEVLDAV